MTTLTNYDIEACGTLGHQKTHIAVQDIIKVLRVILTFVSWQWDRIMVNICNNHSDLMEYGADVFHKEENWVIMTMRMKINMIIACHSSQKCYIWYPYIIRSPICPNWWKQDTQVLCLYAYCCGNIFVLMRILLCIRMTVLWVHIRHSSQVSIHSENVCLEAVFPFPLKLGRLLISLRPGLKHKKSYFSLCSTVNSSK